MSELVTRHMQDMARALIRDFGWEQPPRIDRVDMGYVVQADAYEICVRALADKVGPLRPGVDSTLAEYVIHERIDRYCFERDSGLGMNPRARYNLQRAFERIYWEEVENARMRAQEQDVMNRLHAYMRAVAVPDPMVVDDALRTLSHIRRHHHDRQHGTIPLRLPANPSRLRDVEDFRRQAMQQIPWEIGVDLAAGPDQTATAIHHRSRQYDAELQRRARAITREVERNILLGAFFPGAPWETAGDPAAEKRAMDLLLANLTAEQRATYEAHRYFEVVGGSTGRRYRIKHGRQMNIVELSKYHRTPTRGLCFLPQGGLAVGDVMLGQKMALELYEKDALRVANEFAVSSRG